MSAQRYIGLMSGTSVDGVDIAIVDFDNSSAPSLVAATTFPYPAPLRQQLIESQQPDRLKPDDFGALDQQLGLFYAEKINVLLAQNQLTDHDIQAIGSHGHTFFHQPNAPHPFTLQIGDPNIICERTNINVVADFRRKDMAAGGQGAPLAPAFHEAFFASKTDTIAVVNIGGIANITILSPDYNTVGFDCGPGNTLIDRYCQKFFQLPYDDEGELSASGLVHENTLDTLLSDAYFQKQPPKSTGPEYFSPTWFEQKVGALQLSPIDTLATLSELTATSIAQAITSFGEIKRIYVCGGGAKNTALMQRLQILCGTEVNSTEKVGVHHDWVEAIAFAWFAKQTVEGRASNLPSVTGADRAVILGGLYQANR